MCVPPSFACRPKDPDPFAATRLGNWPKSAVMVTFDISRLTGFPHRHRTIHGRPCSSQIMSRGVLFTHKLPALPSVTRPVGTGSNGVVSAIFILPSYAFSLPGTFLVASEYGTRRHEPKVRRELTFCKLYRQATTGTAQPFPESHEQLLIDVASPRTAVGSDRMPLGVALKCLKSQHAPATRIQHLQAQYSRLESCSSGSITTGYWTRQDIRDLSCCQNNPFPPLDL